MYAISKHAIPKIVLICSAILLPLMLMTADKPQNAGSEAEINQVDKASAPAPRYRFDIEKFANGFR